MESHINLVSEFITLSQYPNAIYLENPKLRFSTKTIIIACLREPTDLYGNLAQVDSNYLSLDPGYYLVENSKTFRCPR